MIHSNRERILFSNFLLLDITTFLSTSEQFANELTQPNLICCTLQYVTIHGGLSSVHRPWWVPLKKKIRSCSVLCLVLCWWCSAVLSYATLCCALHFAQRRGLLGFSECLGRSSLTRGGGGGAPTQDQCIPHLLTSRWRAGGGALPGLNGTPAPPPAEVVVVVVVW